MTTKSLVETADYFHRNGYPVPVDILSRLLEAGLDISKYNHA